VSVRRPPNPSLAAPPALPRQRPWSGSW